MPEDSSYETSETTYTTSEEDDHLGNSRDYDVLPPVMRLPEDLDTWQQEASDTPTKLPNTPQTPPPPKVEHTSSRLIKKLRGEKKYEIEESSDDGDGEKNVIVGKSCFVVSPAFPPRVFIHTAVTTLWFNILVSVVIFANVVFLTLESRGEREASEEQKTILFRAEIFFVSFFTLEALLKMFAFGVVGHESSYLRSSWNQLDFAVVLLALAWYLPGVEENFPVIRSFRVLRVVRTLHSVPGLREIMEALAHALPRMMNVMFLGFFFVAIFAIAATELFGGKLRNRCVTGKPPYTFDVNDNVCGRDAHCVQSEAAGVAATAVWMCRRVGENPHFGWVGFDNFGLAVLTLLQVITLDNWDQDIMDPIIRVTHPASSVFFVLMVMIGAYFMINLTLAIVADAYNASLKRTLINDVQADTKRLNFERVEIDTTKQVSVPTIDFSSSVFEAVQDEGFVVLDVFLRRPMQTDELGKEPQKITVGFHTLPYSGGKSEAHPYEKFVPVNSTLTFEPGESRRPLVVPIVDDREPGDNEYFTVEMKDPSPGVIIGQGAAKVVVVNNSNPGQFSLIDGTVTVNKGETEVKLAVLRTEGCDGTATVGYHSVDGTAKRGIDFEPADGMLVFPNGKKRKEIIVNVTPGREPASLDAMFSIQLMEPSHKARLGAPRAEIIIKGERPPGCRKACHTVVLHPVFTAVIFAVTVANAIALAAYYPGMSADLESALFYANLVFTGIFTIETTLKLIGLEFKSEFMVDRFNVFDAVVVLVSLIEIVIIAISQNRDSSLGLSVLRTFRLLRVFKLVRNWPSLKKILQIIWQSVGSMVHLTVVLLVYVTSAALVGMQLFGGKFDTLVPKPRFSYDDFFWAASSVFRILVGEWSEGMRNAAVATEPVVAISFYLLVMLAGIFLVLNVFLAILLSRFEGVDLKLPRMKSVEPADEEKNVHLHRPVVVTFSKMMNTASVAVAFSVSSGVAHTARRASSMGMPEDHSTTLSEMSKSEDESAKMAGSKRRRRSSISERVSRRLSVTSNAIPEPLLGSAVWDQGNRRMTFTPNVPFLPSHHVHVRITRDAEDTSGDPLAEDVKISFETAMTEGIAAQADEAMLVPKALFCLPADKHVRKYMSIVVNHAIFKATVFGLVLVSSAALAFEEPGLNEDSDMARALYIMNVVFAALFMVEVIMKIIVQGFIMHPGAYMRSKWNLLDLSIALVSVASVILTDSALNSVRAVRALRAFRPLGAVRRNTGMRIVLHALASTIPAIMNVALVCILFWTNFAIFGVQAYGAKFRQCTDPSIRFEVDCVGTFGVDALNTTIPRTWVKQQYHFDNVGYATIALSKIATFDDWDQVFLSSIDSTSIGEAPREDASRHWALYYLLFMIVGSFFLLNLFIGVVIDKFNSMKSTVGGFALMSMEQAAFRDAFLITKHLRPEPKVDPPTGGCLLRLHVLVLSTGFEVFTLVCVFGAAVTAACDQYGARPGYALGVAIAVHVWAGLFWIECLLRVVVMRRKFMLFWWCQFDAVIFAATVVGACIEAASGSLGGASSDEIGLVKLALLLRVGRLARAFRITQHGRGMKKLLLTLVYASSSLLNVGSLLFLVFFIYAVLGMSLFGNIKLNGGLTEDINFRTFWRSMILLFKLSNGEGWSDIMMACSVRPPECDISLGECGSLWIAAPYFICFLITVFVVLINLYIAVILESFQQAQHEADADISPENFEQFRDLWNELDPNANYYIKEEQVAGLLCDLSAPLGFKDTVYSASPEIMGTFLNSPELGPDVLHTNGKVLYYDLLLALVKHAMGNVFLPDDVELAMKEEIFKGMPVAVRQQHRIAHEEAEAAAKAAQAAASDGARDELMQRLEELSDTDDSSSIIVAHGALILPTADIATNSATSLDSVKSSRSPTSRRNLSRQDSMLVPETEDDLLRFNLSEQELKDIHAPSITTMEHVVSNTSTPRHSATL